MGDLHNAYCAPSAGLDPGVHNVVLHTRQTSSGFYPGVGREWTKRGVSYYCKMRGLEFTAAVFPQSKDKQGVIASTLQ